MKQLNWWRGLWRVWVIGTVFWAVTTFWQSDPRCLINLIDPSTYKRPWCVYRELGFQSPRTVDHEGEPYRDSLYEITLAESGHSDINETGHISHRFAL